MAVRRSVLGDTHVDRAEAAKTDFDAPFQTMITEGAWGTLWAAYWLAISGSLWISIISSETKSGFSTTALTAFTACCGQ